jgi:sodium transport system permease protein
MAILAAAVTLAAATPARSTKEAMSYLTPIMFVAIMLSITPMLPGLNLGIKAALIPIANFSWLLKELLQGDWSWRGFALTMGANLLYGGLAFATVVRLFRS